MHKTYQNPSAKRCHDYEAMPACSVCGESVSGTSWVPVMAPRAKPGGDVEHFDASGAVHLACVKAAE